MVVEASLRRPTNVECTGDIGLHPLEDFGNFLPIRHFLVVELLNGRASDDHSVELLFLEDVEVLVEHHHVLDGRIFRRVTLEFHEIHLQLQRRIGKQPHQVGFRGDFKRHEVENYDAQRTDILRMGPGIVHHEDILLLEQFDSWKLVGNS